MVISPLSPDTPFASGPISSRTPLRGETAGFSEQLRFADSALGGFTTPAPARAARESVSETPDRTRDQAQDPRGPGAATLPSVRIPTVRQMATPAAVSRKSTSDPVVDNPPPPRLRAAHEQPDRADDKIRDTYKNEGQGAPVPDPAPPAPAPPAQGLPVAALVERRRPVRLRRRIRCPRRKPPPRPPHQ